MNFSKVGDKTKKKTLTARRQEPLETRVQAWRDPSGRCWIAGRVWNLQRLRPSLKRGDKLPLLSCLHGLFRLERLESSSHESWPYGIIVTFSQLAKLSLYGSCCWDTQKAENCRECFKCSKWAYYYERMVQFTRISREFFLAFPKKSHPISWNLNLKIAYSAWKGILIFPAIRNYEVPSGR